MKFPLIVASATGSEKSFESCAAIQVSSLVKSSILVGEYYRVEEKSGLSGFINPEQLQSARESLLAAISAWSSETCLEIRISVMPNLIHAAQSSIELYLVIRCCAESKSLAKETVAKRYVALTPLLASHFPEAEFEPIVSRETLDRCLTPFSCSHAISVQRKKENINLGTSLQRLAIGFGADIVTVADGDHSLMHNYPWLPSHDDWYKLLETMSGQLDPLQMIVRVIPGISTVQAVDKLAEDILRCESFLAGQSGDRTSIHLVETLRNLYVQRLSEMNGHCFSIGIFLLAGHSIDSSLANVIGQAVSGSHTGKHEPAFFQGGFDSSEVNAILAYSREGIVDQEPFTLGEAACAFRLPAPPVRDIPGVSIKRYKTSLALLPACLAEKPAAMRLFINDHHGMTQPVHLDIDDRMRHCFIMGQTGTGKSSLMESMILQDIRAERGIAVIDPHGEMIDSIIAKIPRDRHEEVILFDLLDRERPLGFNLLEWRTIDERDLIIDELYRTLDHIYDMKQTGGPIFELHFRNMMKLLMGDSERENYSPTILEFVKCYVDRKFRHWLLDSISDQQVKDFIEEAEDAGGEASMRNISPYVTSKFARFVSDTTLKRIVGQEKSTFDFEQIMNEGNILLVKLGKGRFGSQVSALLANMMVARFKFAAMKRGEIPKADRRDFFLYVDEAHNLPQDNFTELLSEARKYRMGLVLATQYCSQLGDLSGKGNDLLAGIFGNVGTTIIFRSGTNDAEHLSKALTPYFTSQDILNLPNFHGYTRMNLAHEVMPPFSFRTELNLTLEDPAVANRIRSLSRLKYGRDAMLIDNYIQKRYQGWKQ